MFNAFSILRDRIRFASIQAEEGHEVMPSYLLGWSRKAEVNKTCVSWSWKSSQGLCSCFKKMLGFFEWWTWSTLQEYFHFLLASSSVPFSWLVWGVSEAASCSDLMFRKKKKWTQSAKPLRSTRAIISASRPANDFWVPTLNFSPTGIFKFYICLALPEYFPSWPEP